MPKSQKEYSKNSNQTQNHNNSKNKISKNDVKEIFISPYKFKVIYEEHLKITSNKSKNSELFGYIDFDNETIYIDPRISETMIKTTLVHEIIHGILFRAGFLNHDEHYVDAIAKGFIDLINCNPDLIEFLRSKNEKGDNI